MKNLTRYVAPYVKLNDSDDCGMMPDVNGEWVKFSDYLEGVRERAPNSQSIKLRQIIIELGKRGVIGASERDTAIVDEICKREGVIK